MTTISMAGQQVPVVKGGLYDRFRSNPPLSVIAAEAPDVDLSWFKQLKKEKVDIGYSAPGSRKVLWSLKRGQPTKATYKDLCAAAAPKEFDLHIRLNLGKASAIDSKDRIGYLPEERGLYRKMKVGPFLQYMARLKGQDATGLEQKVKFWLDKVGLKDVYRKKCDEVAAKGYEGFAMNATAPRQTAAAS